MRWDADELSTYSVEVRRRPQKTFRSLRIDGDSTGLNFRAAGQGLTYDFRVVATDSAGNRSRPKSVTAVVPIDQTRKVIRLNSGWRRNVKRQSTYGGTLARATRAGAAATLSFVGRRVAVLAPVNAPRSRFAITLDGVTRTVRIGGRGGLAKPVFDRRVEPGRHTIRIRALDRRAMFDAIAVER